MSHCDQSFRLLAELPPSPTKPAVSMDLIPESGGEPLPTDQSGPIETAEDHSGLLATDQTRPMTGDGIDMALKEQHEMLTSVVLDHSSKFATQGILCVQ